MRDEAGRALSQRSYTRVYLLKVQRVEVDEVAGNVDGIQLRAPLARYCARAAKPEMTRQLSLARA